MNGLTILTMMINQGYINLFVGILRVLKIKEINEIDY